MAEKRRDGIHQLTFEDLFGDEFGPDKKSADKKPESATPKKQHKTSVKDDKSKGNVSVQTEVPAERAPDKPKRHRRTKAEIEADRAGETEEAETKTSAVSSKAEKASSDDKKTDTVKDTEMMPARKKAKKTSDTVSADKDTVRMPVRRRRKKAETGSADSDVPAPVSADKKPEKDSAISGTAPEPSAEAEEEHIVFQKETPCPFTTGESVSLKYGGRLFTVLSIDGNTVRCVQTEGEPLECTIACSDLKHSDKPPRKKKVEKQAE